MPLVLESVLPVQSAVASHQHVSLHSPSSCQQPEQEKQRKKLVKQSKESSRTRHKVSREIHLKQRVRRNPRVTYRRVHQLVETFFEMVGGGCPELCVLVNIGGHSSRLIELEALRTLTISMPSCR